MISISKPKYLKSENTEMWFGIGTTSLSVQNDQESITFVAQQYMLRVGAPRGLIKLYFPMPEQKVLKCFINYSYDRKTTVV